MNHGTSHEEGEMSKPGDNYAVLAEFDHPDDLLHACEKIRDSEVRYWDAFTPFPVHGLDEAMGEKQTKLPWIVLAAGLTGLGGGVLLQWWTNSVAYPFKISGKPLFSLPANIPIVFEMTVLFAALATFVSVLLLGGMPKWSNPLHRKKRFMRATADRFFIAIFDRDPSFHSGKAQEMLSSLGATDVDYCPADPTSDQLPSEVKWVGLLIPLLALAPFLMFVTARHSTSTEPRFHVVPDMDWQPYFKGQAANPLFADGRAMRMPVEGTVARGELGANEHLEFGLDDGDYATTFPMKVDEALMNRGQERFAIYCSPCHGMSGDGDGMVTKRAQQKGYGWVPPSNLHAESVTKQPVGQLFESISNGVRNIPGYASQISTRDRWAILLYVKALWRQRDASEADVPAEAKDKIK